MDTGYHELGAGRNTDGSFTAETIAQQDYISCFLLVDYVLEGLIQFLGLLMQAKCKNLVGKVPRKVFLYFLPDCFTGYNFNLHKEMQGSRVMKYRVIGSRV
jgi:hypothetical protein